MLKWGFTLVEVLIAVAIIGIIAAIVIAEFQDQSYKAREAAAHDILRIVRTQIEMYGAQYDGVAPGYLGNSPGNPVSEAAFSSQMVPIYLRALPENPFNGKTTINLFRDGEAFPSEATGVYGWVYQPETRDFRMDTAGTDSEGVDYWDY